MYCFPSFFFFFWSPTLISRYNVIFNGLSFYCIERQLSRYIYLRLDCIWRPGLESWLSFSSATYIFVGSNFLIRKNRDSMTCLLSLQRKWLRIMEVEIVINFVFVVANQRAGLNYDIWAPKHQGRVNLARPWYRPLNSIMGEKMGPNSAHHTHRYLNVAGKKHSTQMTIIIFTPFDQCFQYCFWLPPLFNIFR